ncbi:MAG: macro domain-containing protein [Clostridia bacterium]|nr:macro domain-containing protein [Clostridia bacterium]
MPLKIVRNDITKMKCDCIVNPTNNDLYPYGSADLAIHKAAGKGLLEACGKLGGCSVGQAKITDGYKLPSKYVIHTVGPVWKGGGCGETELLVSCYKSCLTLALENGCRSIAIPLISSGTNGYPKDKVMRVAINAVGSFLLENEMTVYIVVYDKNSYEISGKLFDEITSYINDRYIEEYELTECQECMLPPTDDDTADMFRVSRNIDAAAGGGISKSRKKKKLMTTVCPTAASMAMPMPCKSKSLEDMLSKMDKGFAETLFEFIDQKGLTDVECYKRSNVDKKTFSKIKCNKDYRPSKVTAVSFAIGLKLSLEETNRLLKTVGLSLSGSNKFDIIIEYFITSGKYENIYDVNEVLYQFDQVTLGV